MIAALRALGWLAFAATLAAGWAMYQRPVMALVLDTALTCQ